MPKSSQMPTNSEFCFNVCVGGTPLWEYTDKDGKLYIESSMQTNASYNMPVGDGVEEVMVTPYHIDIQSHKDTPPAFYKLFIDGKHIMRMYLTGGRQREITGVKQGNNISEFVFTLPMEAQSKSDTSSSAVTSVGEIEVVMFHAIDTGRTEMYSQQQMLPVCPQDANTRPRRFFNSISKNDVTKRTQGKYPLLHTEVGKNVLYSQRTQNVRTRRVYREGKRIKSAKIYYRPRLALEILGVLKPADVGKDAIDVDSLDSEEKKIDDKENVSPKKNSPEIAATDSSDVIMCSPEKPVRKSKRVVSCSLEKTTNDQSKAKDKDAIEIDSLELEEQKIDDEENLRPDINSRENADDNDDVIICSPEKPCRNPKDTEKTKNSTKPRAMVTRSQRKSLQEESSDVIMCSPEKPARKKFCSVSEDEWIVLDDTIDSQTEDEPGDCVNSELYTDFETKAKVLGDVTNNAKEESSDEEVPTETVSPPQTPPPLPLAVKQELLDTGAVSSPPCLWTDDEPSILYDGDDDCHITLVRKPWDITVLELEDDEDEGEEGAARRRSVAVFAGP